MYRYCVFYVYTKNTTVIFTVKKKTAACQNSTVKNTVGTL